MKILFTSLGCDKNLVDAEMMLGILGEAGHTFTDDETEAEAVVVNTCCFISDAKEESIQTILEFAELRKAGSIKALIVTGCLAQRYSDEIKKEIPEVDAILGISDFDEVARALDEALMGQGIIRVGNCSAAPICGKKRVLTTGGHYAFMKIAEGCDKHCTYCIIPKIRGTYRSVPMEMLLKEAKELAEEGVQELILVAQETTLYGIDLYGEKKLPELLNRLCEIENLRWIRIQYCYPEEITQELIDTIEKQPKICHYLDIPVQHAADNILRRMGRKTSQEDLRTIIGKLRAQIPDICLRTTLISGFPGETQEDFEELYRFVNDVEFDRLGVFAYSAEENTPAAEMPDQIPEDVKTFRRDELMELQQEIAFEKAEAKLETELDVVIEGYLPQDDIYVGRSYMDAPGVDGFVFLESEKTLESGDFVRARIIGSREYDLIAEPIG